MARCRNQWPLCCQTDLTKTRSHHCNIPLNPCASTNQQCTSNVLQAPSPNRQMVGYLLGVVQLEGLQPLPWLKLLRPPFLPLTSRRLKNSGGQSGKSVQSSCFELFTGGCFLVRRADFEISAVTDFLSSGVPRGLRERQPYRSSITLVCTRVH